jgi:arylsulfatase/arylsulfatase A
MNVLLIIADSLRAHNTSVYGYHRDTTPFLETLANESIKYDKAIAPSTWSLPSHASMFTGLQAEEHQLLGTDSALGEYETIWNDFQDAGYSTGVFSANPFITEPSYGLTAGFDTVSTEIERQSWSSDGLHPTDVDLATDRNTKLSTSQNIAS